MGFEQFCQVGCPNCPDLAFQNEDPQEVTKAVASEWEGQVAMIRPYNHWMQRATRLNTMIVPGLYAVHIVTGKREDPNARDFEAEYDM